MGPNRNCEVISPPEAWGENAILMHYDRSPAMPGYSWPSRMQCILNVSRPDRGLRKREEGKPKEAVFFLITKEYLDFANCQSH